MKAIIWFMALILWALVGIMNISNGKITKADYMSCWISLMISILVLFLMSI